MRTSEHERQQVRARLGKLRASRGGAAAHNQVWEASNTDKVKAHKTVENAVVAGRLRRSPCVVCGEKAHAHHEDYSKPLRVIWLCAAHHKDRHAALDLGVAEDWSHLEVEARPPYGFTSSGHQNITWQEREQRWEVRLRRKSTQVRKMFKRLEDALKFRDALDTDHQFQRP